MKQMLLQAGCDPLRASTDDVNNTDSNPLLEYILRGCALINDTTFPVYVDIVDPNKKISSAETDSGAVMYIVVVLVFYSAGIIVMIVKYLRREKRELEEERILEDFFRSMPAYKKEREQNNVNRVAIQAFHALTSFSYDDGDDVYTSDEDDSKARADIIHETEAEHQVKDESVSVFMETSDMMHSTEKPTQTTFVEFNEDICADMKLKSETHL